MVFRSDDISRFWASRAPRVSVASLVPELRGANWGCLVGFAPGSTGVPWNEFLTASLRTRPRASSLAFPPPAVLTVSVFATAWGGAGFSLGGVGFGGRGLIITLLFCGMLVGPVVNAMWYDSRFA